MSDSKHSIPKVKRRLVLDNSVFNLYMDDIDEDGKTVVRDFLVISPKSRREKDLVAGVAVLPIYRGKLGLLRIYRHPVMDFVWEAPRGFIDDGETEEQAAIRELEEETGLLCTPDNIHSLGVFMPEAGVFSARIRIFVAVDCVKLRDYTPNELGHRELRFFETIEFERMIARSEIQDPGTLISYFRYRTEQNPG